MMDNNIMITVLTLLIISVPSFFTTKWMLNLEFNEILTKETLSKSWLFVCVFLMFTFLTTLFAKNIGDDIYVDEISKSRTDYNYYSGNLKDHNSIRFIKFDEGNFDVMDFELDELYVVVSDGNKLRLFNTHRHVTFSHNTLVDKIGLGFLDDKLVLKKNRVYESYTLEIPVSKIEEIL